MADLDEKQSSLAIKQTGGDETTFADVDPLNRLLTKDVLKSGGLTAAVSVTTTVIEAKAGASALSNRAVLTVYNSSSTNQIWWSFTNSNAAGTPINPNQTAFFNAGTNCKVYIYTLSGTATANISEGA